MTEIIAVRFADGTKDYYFDPQGLDILPGDGLILDTSRGNEFATCSQGNRMVDESQVVQPLRPVIRLATQSDLNIVAANREKEKKAHHYCVERIAAHKLDMQLVKVECNFDSSKILFFFTAEARVDFRALVKDLAAAFHTRIELRQIGVRDEAKMLGGLGICGRPLCCSSFLRDFQPVSIKMAKTQNLSLNPTKISGTCGRLMCCLKYEQDAYEDAVRRCPKMESFVETPDGVGTVTHVNLLKEQVKVFLEDSHDPPKSFHNCEVCVVRNGKGKRPEGYIAPPPAELAKLRRPKDTEEEDVTFVPTLSTGAKTIAYTAPAAAPVSPPPAPKNEGGRRRSRGEGRPTKPAAPAPAPVEATPAPTGEREGKRPRNQRPRVANKPRPPRGEEPRTQDAPKGQSAKPQPPKVQATKPQSGDAPASQKPAPKRNNRRRWPPRDKKPKPQGDGNTQSS